MIKIMFSYNSKTFTILCTALSGIILISHWIKKRKQKELKWEKIGHVEKLRIYPLKSARGIEVDTAKTAPTGLHTENYTDRNFVVYTKSGTLVTGRTAPSLMTMTCNITEHNLLITDIDGTTINVDLNYVTKRNNVIQIRLRESDTSGYDCGEEVSEWLTKRLFQDGTPVVLLYFGDLNDKRMARKPKYFEFPKFKTSDKMIFQDCTPYTIQTTASLEILNSKITNPATWDRFRPNIVIKTELPFDEDNWDDVKIGKAIFRVTKPCERCALTWISPETGEKTPEAFDMLKTFRILKTPTELAKQWKFKPVFGLKCCIDSYGDINVNDEVYVVKRDNKNYYTFY